MSVISIVCFLICFGVVITCFSKRADILSPSRIFVFLWSFAIGITDLKLSALQFEWNNTGWMLLLIGVAAFLVGTFVVFVLNFTVQLTPMREVRLRLSRRQFDESVFFKIILVVFAAYVVSYLASYLIKGFIPLLSKRPGQMRTQFGVFGFGLIVHAAPAVMFFVVQYFVSINKRGFHKFVLALVFLFTAGSYFLLLQRFDFAIWAIVSFVFFYYATRYVSLKTVLITILPFVGIFYWVSSLRLIGAIKYYMFLMSKMKISTDYAFVTEPYMYVATNLENFVRSSQKLDQFTFGYYSLNFISSLTGLRHWMGEYFNLDDTPYLTSGYNTYSFLWTYYRDFGVVGLALFPFLEGMIIAHLYYAMRKQPSILNVSLYALAVFVMLISFFHNAPSMLQFVFVAIMIYIVNRMVLQRQLRPNQFVASRGIV